LVIVNEKVQKDKQQSTKHTHKTKDPVTRTPLKTGVNSGAPERQIFFLVKEIDIIVLDKHTHIIECKKKTKLPYLKIISSLQQTTYCPDIFFFSFYNTFNVL
jgi:hypothetical protein